MLFHCILNTELLSIYLPSMLFPRYLSLQLTTTTEQVSNSSKRLKQIKSMIQTYLQLPMRKSQLSYISTLRKNIDSDIICVLSIDQRLRCRRNVAND